MGSGKYLCTRISLLIPDLRSAFIDNASVLCDDARSFTTTDATLLSLIATACLPQNSRIKLQASRPHANRFRKVPAIS